MAHREPINIEQENRRLGELGNSLSGISYLVGIVAWYWPLHSDISLARMATVAATADWEQVWCDCNMPTCWASCFS